MTSAPYFKENFLKCVLSKIPSIPLKAQIEIFFGNLTSHSDQFKSMYRGSRCYFSHLPFQFLDPVEISSLFTDGHNKEVPETPTVTSTQNTGGTPVHHTKGHQPGPFFSLTDSKISYHFLVKRLEH